MKEHFENTGYISDDKPVDIQVISDEKNVMTIVQDLTASWRVQKVILHLTCRHRYLDFVIFI